MNFTTEPLILIFALIFAITLMILSRAWKQKIFSIFSVGVWVFIAIIVSSQIPLLIVCFFLILEELYYSLISKI